MGLYEPAIEKMMVQEIREKRRIDRLHKSALRKEKREKYKILYKEELSKERAKLKAQRESDIEQYKTKRAIEKAHARARSRVKPFTPRNGLKMPSKRLTPEQKRRLNKAGIDTGKSVVWLGQKGLIILDLMYGGGKGGMKITKIRKSTKRKYKKKSPKRKTAKRKGKTYYCRKCKQRHSYSSKIGRKHR